MLLRQLHFFEFSWPWVTTYDVSLAFSRCQKIPSFIRPRCVFFTIGAILEEFAVLHSDRYGNARYKTSFFLCCEVYPLFALLRSVMARKQRSWTPVSKPLKTVFRFRLVHPSWQCSLWWSCRTASSRGGYRNDSLFTFRMEELSVLIWHPSFKLSGVWRCINLSVGQICNGDGSMTTTTFSCRLIMRKPARAKDAANANAQCAERIFILK